MRAFRDDVGELAARGLMADTSRLPEVGRKDLRTLFAGGDDLRLSPKSLRPDVLPEDQVTE